MVAGSTGEANALDDSEYDALLQVAVRQVADRIPVLAGTGTSNTAKTIALTRRALQSGAECRPRGDAALCPPDLCRPGRAFPRGGRAGRPAGGALQRARTHRLRHAARDRGRAGRASEHHRHQGSGGRRGAHAGFAVLRSPQFAVLSG